MNVTQLSKAFTASIERIESELRSFPWSDRSAYALWLGQTYYLVSHTTRFLALTAGKFGPHQDSLHKRAVDHLREERGHDVMAIKDLKHMGIAIDDIPELCETSAIYQSQYYWIEMRDPSSHLGYALMLEGLAPRVGSFMIAAIEKAHGKDTSLFMRVHAADDVEHFEQGMKSIAGYPEAVQAEILKNLKQSEEFYSRMLKGIKAAAKDFALSSETTQNRKAA